MIHHCTGQESEFRCPDRLHGPVLGRQRPSRVEGDFTSHRCGTPGGGRGAETAAALGMFGAGRAVEGAVACGDHAGASHAGSGTTL